MSIEPDLLCGCLLNAQIKQGSIPKQVALHGFSSKSQELSPRQKALVHLLYKQVPEHAWRHAVDATQFIAAQISVA
jgi:hypothetical protein